MAGDFNCDLSSSDKVVDCISNFMRANSLVRCDSLFPSNTSVTYVNYALNQQSYIDYVLMSNPTSVNDFKVLDPDVNFSDHLPLSFTLLFTNSNIVATRYKTNTSDKTKASERRLRWDKADLSAYYHSTNVFTRLSLEINEKLEACSSMYDQNGLQRFVDSVYDEIVYVLANAAALWVPCSKKNYYKFWWNEELKSLKAASVESNSLQKAAGRPRQGAIFEKRQKCRLRYRQQIKDIEKRDKLEYTNALHEGLIKKDGKKFWKIWRSKFEKSSSCGQVDQCVDDNIIVDKFAVHFRNCYTYNNAVQAESLCNEQAYVLRRWSNYQGMLLSATHTIDTELVSLSLIHI